LIEQYHYWAALLQKTMSSLELPPRSTIAPVARAQSSAHGFALTFEQLAYLAIVTLALLTRLWELDNRALHHDETLHAYFAWAVLQGQGYVHDPLLHGPFLYFFGALIYFLFGDSDATARLGPALFGTALVAMPYLLRRELGRGAALAASIFLLISPVFLYIGRFIRHDPYSVLFELLALIGIVRFVSTRRARWLYASAASLGLMAANMETFYLYMAIFAPVVVGALLWRVWRAGLLLGGGAGLLIVALVLVLPGYPERPSPTSDTVNRANGPYVCPSEALPFPPPNPILTARPGPIFGWPPLETFDNNFALCARHQPDNNLGLYFIKLGQFMAHPAIITALVVALTAVGAFVWQIWRRPGPDGLTRWQRARQEEDAVLAAFAALGQGQRWLIALGAFFVPYALLFTAFFTNPVGVLTGTSGSLLYWLAQHEVERGGQPRHYYAVLLAIYEPLIVLWGLVGLMVCLRFWILDFGLSRLGYIRNRAPRLSTAAIENPKSTIHNWALPTLLAWWTIATFLLYSWAGEKMPWLTIHLVLPLALLGGWALARTLAWSRVLSKQADERTRGREEEKRRKGEEENGMEDAADSAAISSSPLLPFSSSGSALPFSSSGSSLAIYLGVFAAIVALCFLLLAVRAELDTPQAELTPWIPLLAVTLIGLLTAGSALLAGTRWATGALALGLTLTLGLYGVRSAFQLSYQWGDVPREMMIYTQTSPDVRRVIDRLELAATRRGGALELGVWYDNETVWDWYMRRFANAAEQPAMLDAAPGSEVDAVLMLQENYAFPENAEKLDGFRIQRYPLRWWFPEEQTYRLPDDWTTAPVDENSPLLMRMLRTPFDTRTSVQFWQYILYRVPPAPLGSTDFVVAVRPELADEIGLGTGGDQ
jgi:predicted membrane-bound mannosyltransferase